MDTLGNLIDKQLTVIMKYTFNEHAPKEKRNNLMQQRRSLAVEINDTAKGILTGQIDPKDAMRPQHKTY